MRRRDYLAVSPNSRGNRTNLLDTPYVYFLLHHHCSLIKKSRPKGIPRDGTVPPFLSDETSDPSQRVNGRSRSNLRLLSSNAPGRVRRLPAAGFTPSAGSLWAKEELLLLPFSAYSICRVSVLPPITDVNKQNPYFHRSLTRPMPFGELSSHVRCDDNERGTDHNER